MNGRGFALRVTIRRQRQTSYIPQAQTTSRDQKPTAYDAVVTTRRGEERDKDIHMKLELIFTKQVTSACGKEKLSRHSHGQPNSGIAVIFDRSRLMTTPVLRG